MKKFKSQPMSYSPYLKCFRRNLTRGRREYLLFHTAGENPGGQGTRAGRYPC